MLPFKARIISMATLLFNNLLSGERTGVLKSRYMYMHVRLKSLGGIGAVEGTREDLAVTRFAITVLQKHYNMTACQ